MSCYRTVVADPPWDVMGGPPWGGGISKPLPYPSMTVEQIAALPVRAMADRAAHLYLWTINAYLEDTYEIARLWGFRPSTLLTWTKPITGGGARRHLPTVNAMVPLRPTRSPTGRTSDRPEPLRLAPAARALPKARSVPGHG